jgi:hypothetical protein
MAVAALARSMALALERAAADRPEPAPSLVADPAMAALAERYLGAPEHWLAHVATRTAQLAETGAAPLSVSSHASAWPPSLPGAVGPLAPLTPTAPAGDEAIERDPPRLAAARRDAVPSLAALRERSSELWRREETLMRRRPRPVFAPVPAAPAESGPSSEGGSGAGRRPRSPLTLETRPPSSKAAERPSFVASPSESGASAEAWRKARPAPVQTIDGQTIEKPSAAPPTRSSEPATAPAPRSAITGRPEPKPDRAETSRAAAPTSPVAFGEPPVMSLIDAPPRASSWANEPAQVPAAERPTVAQPPKRPAARRSIFQTLAMLSAGARRASAGPAQAVTEPKSVPIGVTRSKDDAGPMPFYRARALSRQESVGELASSVTGPEGAVRGVQAKAPGQHGEPWSASLLAGGFATDEAAREPRARFAIDRPSPPVVVRQSERSSSDSRWPDFPPNLFTPPKVAEIPASRLDQLAREQEEGRWSV